MWLEDILTFHLVEIILIFKINSFNRNSYVNLIGSVRLYINIPYLHLP